MLPRAREAKFTGLVLPLGSMVMVIGTWIFLYQLTSSVAAALALAGVQLLVVGYCYIQYRKAVAANRCPHDGGAMRASLANCSELLKV